MSDISDTILDFIGVDAEYLQGGGLVESILSIVDIPLRFMGGISTLTSYNTINGIIGFIFHMILYIPYLFIILQASIIGLSVVNGNGEDGKLSPFTLIQNFVEYQIYWITSLFSILMFGLDMAYKAINSVIPV